MNFDNLGSSLNETISSGVQSMVEARVLEALSDGEFTKAAVSAALNRQVGEYRDKTTYLNKILGSSIEELTKKVVAEEIQRQQETIRAEVRAAIGQSLDVITDSLVGGFLESTRGTYPQIKVTFQE